MSKKSLFALLLALCLLVSAIGCSQPAATTTTPAPAESQAPADAPAEPAAPPFGGHHFLIAAVGSHIPVVVGGFLFCIFLFPIVEHKRRSPHQLTGMVKQNSVWPLPLLA